MRTPSPTYVCPDCQTTYERPSRFCGRCGADMRDNIEDAATEHGGLSLAETDPALARSSTPDAPRSPLKRSSDARDRWLGSVIDDRYQVLEIIGRGGMGMVYRVEHQRMGKIAAMKMLHPEYSREPGIVERFRREAEAISRITHPNTVQVFDFGTSQGALYLIMEYVRGQDLSVLLQRDGPVPFSRMALILAQICAALGEAHALGIVHRDLKPENVLVTRTHRGRDFVKILDFGLAKLGEREERAEVTDRGTIVGTPYYMSPEQIRGEEVDARTDIYALGSMMYRMLTGEHAFSAGTPMGVLTAHLTTELIPPSVRAPALDIPPVLDDIVSRAMAKRREERYRTIGEMLDHIERAFVDVCGTAPASGSGLEMLETSSWSTRGGAASSQSLVRDDSDDIDYGIDSAIRLRRADLDVFERSLRRRRRVRMAVVPVMLLAMAGAAAYALFLRPESPRRAEQEPNNQIDDATLIASGRSATGLLGKRISRREPDRDFYRVSLPKGEDGGGDGGLVVSAHVTALPNIDIALSLFDPTGKLLAQISEGGVGHDEHIRRLRVNSSVFALVTEAAPVGVRLPTENVSDSYTLTVTFEPLTPDRESEPNGNPSDALPLRPGTAVSGHLDQRLDVDSYRFEGEPGTYELRITGNAALPVQWRLGTGEPRTERQAEVALEPGAIVELRRTDAEPEPHTQTDTEIDIAGAADTMDMAYTIDLIPN